MKKKEPEVDRRKGNGDDNMRRRARKLIEGNGGEWLDTRTVDIRKKR